MAHTHTYTSESSDFSKAGSGLSLAKAHAISRDKTEMRLDFYHMFWIFVISSFLGLILETLICIPVDGGFKNRVGLVWGPFSPIYGAGAVTITISLWKIRNSNPVKIFLLAGLIGAIVEYIVGWWFEERFGFVAWSYIDQPLNFHGHTSIGIAIAWSIAGLVWIRWLMPLLMHFINRMPVKLRRRVTTIALVFMLVDAGVTIASFNFWFERQAGDPVDTPIEAFFDDNFSDDFMTNRFQTISVWPVLADGQE
jgi:uncharacterized membrane protein